MSKDEMREMKRGARSAAGSAKKELEQIESVQKVNQGTNMEIITISVGCGAVLTLICC